LLSDLKRRLSDHRPREGACVERNIRYFDIVDMDGSTIGKVLPSCRDPNVSDRHDDVAAK
jgi:hypothetical protein